MPNQSFGVVGLLSALVLCGSHAYAQTPSQGWFIDASYIGLQSNQGEQEYATATLAPAGSPMLIDQAYPDMSRAHGFDLTGGYTVGAGVGLAVRWLQSRHDYSIGAYINVFSLIAVDSAESGEVRRTDKALDLMATYTLPIPHPAVHVTLFAGPTYFTATQAMVGTVRYTHTSDGTGAVNDVTIDDVETEDVNGSAWGYNVGGDVAYFFSRHVGVGGGLRYSRGKVEEVAIPVESPLGGDEQAEFDTGNVAIVVGVRFRF